jgi:hypothetical protein
MIPEQIVQKKAQEILSLSHSLELAAMNSKWGEVNSLTAAIGVSLMDTAQQLEEISMKVGGLTLADLRKKMGVSPEPGDVAETAADQGQVSDKPTL